MEMEKQMFSQQMLAGHAERMKHRAEFLQSLLGSFLPMDPAQTIVFYDENSLPGTGPLYTFF